MCSRYRLLDAADIQPRDVYPSQLAPVQTRDGVRDMRWGFAGRTGKGLLINARAETAADKPTFSTALQQTRCVIAASAFYEWNAQKQAFLFENAAEDTPLYLAGLYTQDTDGQERFVILTREANDAVSPVHPRMPSHVIFAAPSIANPEVFFQIIPDWYQRRDYFVPLIHPITHKECPVPERGWRNPSATMQRMMNEGRILFGKDETTIPNSKYLLKENMYENIPSWLGLQNMLSDATIPSLPPGAKRSRHLSIKSTCGVWSAKSLLVFSATDSPLGAFH